MFLLVILITVIGLLSSSVADLLGRALDLGVGRDITGAFSRIKMILFFLAIRSVLIVIQYTLARGVMEGMLLTLRTHAFSTLTKIKLSVLENRVRMGDLSSRLNSDLEGLSDVFSGILTWHVHAVIYAVVALGFCFRMNWKITVLYFTVVPLIIWVTERLSRPIERKKKAVADMTGAAMNVAAEGIRNMETVRTYQAENFLRNRFGGYMDESVESNRQSERLGAVLALIRYFSGVLLLFLLLFLGVFFVRAGELTVGAFVSFAAMSESVRSAIGILDRIFENLRKGNALAWRYYEFLDLETEEQEASDILQLGKEAERREVPAVSFRQLQFGYHADQPVLRGLSFEVSPGQTVGLHGASGSGKSTIFKLLCRLYDPLVGSIWIGKTDICSIDRSRLRAYISLVTQEPVLFDGTIRENLLMGNPDATDEQLADALQAAQLWTYTEGLEYGMDTGIGVRGGKLSGGQRQRLAIARAILRDAPVVLLDEPTSALDAESEAALGQALKRLLLGKTALIISHREATLRRTDYLYELENGKIVAEGTAEDFFDGGIHGETVIS
ncbi:MAG: ABC transporter ATP-binding protein [Roseburia sp.]|nr:ABC transporter ATP-binding protein [Roseburia sp.]